MCYAILANKRTFPPKKSSKKKPPSLIMVQWQQCQCGRVSGHNRWWRWANGHRDWIKQDPHFETWKADVSTRRFCSLRRLTSDRSSRGCFVSEYCRVSDIWYGKWSRESSPSAKQNFSQHKPTLQTTNWGHHQHPHNTLQYNTSQTVSRHISQQPGGRLQLCQELCEIEEACNHRSCLHN